MAVRVGVIGTGQIARYRHIPEYASNPNVELVAFCDVVPEKARKLAEEYGVEEVFTNYEDLLAVDEIDAVSVCTPNYLHAPITIAAARAGKHILVEKPMATSLTEADEMIRAAKDNKVKLMVGHNQRLAPMHQVARKILGTGILGRITTFKTTFGHGGPEHWSPTGKWFFEKEKAFAGAMADLGIHKVDLVRWLLGEEVVSVRALTSRFEKAGTVEDNAMALLEFASGTFGVMTASWTYRPGEDNSTIFYGERGMLKIATDTKRPLILALDEPARGEMDVSVPPLQTNERGGQFNSGVIDTFIDALVNEKTPPIPGEEGRKALEIVLAALKSAETGETVRLPL